MRFTLQPPARQIMLAFPVLLASLPAAMSAEPDQPGLMLPPASLYDAARPGPPTLLTPAPTPAVEAPAAQPPVAKAAEPAPPTPSVATRPAPAATPQAAGQPSEPWYRHWFSWLPWNSSKKSAAQGAPAPQPVVVVQQDVAGPGTDSGSRGQYAYDASSRSIRAGTTGECVKMGVWSPEAASADCRPAAVESKPGPAGPTVAMTPPPKTAPATPAPIVVAVAQPTKQGPAGSAPASIAMSQPKPEPVYVVPLSPAPPAAKEERALEPVEPRSMSHDETIAALAETPLMSEPDKLTFSAGALFALGSNKIKSSGQDKLDEMVEQLKGMHYDKVIIVGHTDPTGSKAMNDKLSKRRAQAVRAYLVSKGVDGKRIQTEGKGGSEPLPKTQSCDTLPRMDKIVCYAPDRRVEVEVVGGKSQASAHIPDGSHV
ncbi:MAG TPA: OmpA family protein [Burkholderiales bacterium]|nr:OmpA family protein [Burkholderiales bacterium]